MTDDIILPLIEDDTGNPLPQASYDLLGRLLTAARSLAPSDHPEYARGQAELIVDAVPGLNMDDHRDWVTGVIIGVIPFILSPFRPIESYMASGFSVKYDPTETMSGPWTVYIAPWRPEHYDGYGPDDLWTPEALTEASVGGEHGTTYWNTIEEAWAYLSGVVTSDLTIRD